MRKTITLSLLFILLNIFLVSAQVIKDIPMGMGIAHSTSIALDWAMDDNDIPTFQDTVIAFQGADYDVHDELVLSKQSPSIETSLTSIDDDYESGVFMEVMKDSIKYYYAFDDAINISTASTTEPLEIEFLGRTLKIVHVNPDGNEFTVLLGKEYLIDVGNSVIIEDKKITLSNVGSGGAIVVDVDGTIATIAASTTQTVNGIEIINYETFYADAKEERSAVLIIGNPAIATYKDGDAYIGEDSNDPDWVWDIGGLGQESSTTISQSTPGTIEVAGPKIGIENDFIKDDDTDNPPSIGGCFSLPKDYAQICLDSLTISDADYLPVTIEYDSSADTAESGHPNGKTDAKTIHIKASVDDTLKLNNGILTHEVWLQMFSENEVGIFYRDTSNVPGVRFYNSINPASETRLLEIIYKSTGNGNIILNTLKNSASNFQIKFDVNGDTLEELPDNSDNIIINFSIINNDIASLGQTISKQEAEELQWGPSYPLGTKDEDHRTRYGIIIKNPRLNGILDKVVLEIPSDDVQANVVIKEKEASTLTHEVIITNLKINPYIVNCGESAAVTFEIKNTGDFIENGYVKVFNSELEIDKQETFSDLKQLSSILKTFTINIPSCAESEDYPIEARIVYGDEAYSQFKTISVECHEPITEYAIEMDEGWNLISIPFKQENTAITSIFNENIDKIDSIYAYNAQNAQWKIWRNEGSVPRTLTNLNIGEGYWIKTNQAFTLNINLSQDEGPITIPTFNVYSGWNLFGYYGTRDEIISTAFRNINNKYSAVWGMFQNNVQVHDGSFRGMDFNEQLKLTYAYWVYMNQNGVIVPTS